MIGKNELKIKWYLIVLNYINKVIYDIIIVENIIIFLIINIKVIYI